MPSDVVISLLIELFIVCLFCRWEKLRTDCENRKKRLERAQEQFEKVEDLFLQFAKRASSFQSWMEDAEEDLTDPVRCNSMEEVKVSLRWEEPPHHTPPAPHVGRNCVHWNLSLPGDCW